MHKNLRRLSIAVALTGFIAFAPHFADANGSDTVAPDSRIEKAVTWAESVARDNTHGYSQGSIDFSTGKPTQYTGSREGPDYDCSSLVYHAFTQAGFNITKAWQESKEFWEWYHGKQETGDADTIWPNLKTIGGFTKYAWTDVSDKLQRGDILCNPEQHVAIYIGNGKTVEARGVNNPRGGSYKTGDQGGEIDFYEAQGRNWTEVYRYTGK